MIDAPALRLARVLFPPAWHDRIFLVGGGVRDLLLGTDSADLDLVVALSAAQLRENGFHPVTPKSATPIFLRYLPDFGKIEATRIDRLEELPADLTRRDFTVNALALDLRGTLHDPLGGLADLEQRRLRPCSATTFRDDPTRLFRAFRFAAAGWHLAPETVALIRQDDWDAPLAQLPVERFSNELLKALAQPQPTRFFQLMLEFGVGRGLLPELFRMPLVPAGPPEHHPEGDLFTHCCQVLEEIVARTNEPLPRFCAFFHDLGKLATDPALYPKHHGHDEAGFTMAGPFCNRLALPAAWRKALAWSSRLHGSANRWDETRDATRIRMADSALKAGIAAFLPLLTAADWPEGPGMPDWPLALEAARLNSASLGIDPEQLDRLHPEQRAGLLLQHRIAWLRAARKKQENL